MAEWVVQQGQQWQHMSGEIREVLAAMDSPGMVVWRKPGSDTVEGIASVGDWLSWIRYSDLVAGPPAWDDGLASAHRGRDQDLQIMPAAQELAAERSSLATQVASEREGDSVIYRVGARVVTLPESLGHYALLGRYLQLVLGHEWFMSGVTSQSRAPLHRLLRTSMLHTRRVRAQAGEMTGNRVLSCCATRELLTLSDDLLTLELASSLPEELTKRLRVRDSYQGARYEAAVAAGLVRAGFELTWMSGDRKPECVAKCISSGEELFIEAKSRHRQVWKSDLSPDEWRGFRKDIGRLYGRACQKEAEGRPLVIFVDAQVPYRAAGKRRGEEALDEARRVIEGMWQPTEQSPAPECLTAITSTGWYFDLVKVAPPVTRDFVMPLWTRERPWKVQTYVSLFHAVNQMYVIPDGDYAQVPMKDYPTLDEYLGSIYGAEV